MIIQHIHSRRSRLTHTTQIFHFIDVNDGVGKIHHSIQVWFKIWSCLLARTSVFDLGPPYVSSESSADFQKFRVVICCDKNTTKSVENML